MTTSIITICDQLGLSIHQLARATELYADTVASQEEQEKISLYEWFNRFNDLPDDVKAPLILEAKKK